MSLNMWSCADAKYDGAVMITASHLPFNRNGFKFFDNKAGFEKKEITDLLSRAAKEASQGSLEEEASFPKDTSQAESSAVQNLENSFNADAARVKKVHALHGLVSGSHYSILHPRTATCHHSDLQANAFLSLEQAADAKRI